MASMILEEILGRIWARDYQGMPASGGEAQGVEELVEDSWERMLQEETQANGPQVCSNGISCNDSAYNHPQAHTWVAVPGGSLLEDLREHATGTSGQGQNGQGQEDQGHDGFVEDSW